MQNPRNSLCRKQRTIFMRKKWIVLINAKNRFYECSKQIWIYSKHDVQRENLLMYKRILSMQKNRFDYCEIQTWKSIQIWLLNLENPISLGVLWENRGQFFKQWTKNDFCWKESEQFCK